MTTTCKKKQKSKFFTFCLFCPYLQITHTKRFFSKASIWCVFRNLYIFRFFTFSLCGVKLYLISKKIIYTTVTTTCKKKQKSKFFTFCLFCPYLQITHTKRFFSKASIWCVFRNLYIFRFFTFSLCGVKLYLISKKIIYTTVTTTCKKKQKVIFGRFVCFALIDQ